MFGSDSQNTTYDDGKELELDLQDLDKGDIITEMKRDTKVLQKMKGKRAITSGLCVDCEAHELSCCWVDCRKQTLEIGEIVLRTPDGEWFAHTHPSPDRSLPLR